MATKKQAPTAPVQRRRRNAIPRPFLYALVAGTAYAFLQAAKYRVTSK